MQFPLQTMFNELWSLCCLDFFLGQECTVQKDKYNPDLVTESENISSKEDSQEACRQQFPYF